MVGSKQDLSGGVYPVILSGGSGTRLWPVSRSLYPKQLLPLTSSRTMLQETGLRFAGDTAYASPLVVCNNDHRFIIAEQLRAAGIDGFDIVLEPAGRNTAPAVAAAAALLVKRDPAAVMVVLPADHAVADVDGFRAALGQAVPLARAGRLVTFGIKPDTPHTGYGYIKRGADLGGGAFAVERFVEKPDAETAAGYLADGAYAWNSGIFVFHAQGYLDELARFRPEMVTAATAAVDGGARDLDFFRLASEPFIASPSDSIDYAVMERTDKAAVIPVDIGWNDVGSWDALWEIGVKDADGNRVSGDVLTRGVKNSFIRSETALVAAIGVDDMTIVQTADAVLVAPRAAAEQVKDIVADLKRDGRGEHETHVRHFRPWGSFETLDLGPRFQVKRLVVKPGQRLSLQMHHRRAEHWVVVAGTAQVVRGEEELTLGEDQSTYIPIGMKHRLENRGDVDLEVIEVQSGDYLGEDDIVRFEDVYNRDPSETK